MKLLSKEDLTPKIRDEARDRVVGAIKELNEQKSKLERSLYQKPALTWVQAACVDIENARQALDRALEWWGEILLADNDHFYVEYASKHTDAVDKLRDMLKDGCTLDDMTNQKSMVDYWADKTYAALRRYAKQQTYTIGDL